jgi:RNA polymerase sigma-70 factor (ECF subfamily)
MPVREVLVVRGSMAPPGHSPSPRSVSIGGNVVRMPPNDANPDGAAGVLRDSTLAGAGSNELATAQYDDLRRLARSYLRRERVDHTLSATEIVHEAFERLAGPKAVEWQGSSHFFATAAKTMRRLLIDHARNRNRVKRGGGWHRLTLDRCAAWLGGESLDLEELVALDEALERLAALDARQARVVELRYFAGLEVEEVAGMLGISVRSVARDAAHGRVWLQRELGLEPAAG